MPFDRSRTFVLLGWMALLLNHVQSAAAINCDTDSANLENQLKKKLLCNGYLADARPRKDKTETVNLTLSYLVLSYEFEELDDLLKMNVRLGLEWYDDFIRWNSSEWGNLDRLSINSEELWLPDFRHFSSYYNPSSLPDCSNPACVVRADGLVRCVPVCSLNAKCDADYFHWPYDTHPCNMWYGLWVNSMDEVDVHAQNVCLADANTFTSSNWDIVSMEQERISYQMTDNFEFPTVGIQVLLQRRSSFENVAVVSPILVLTLLNLYIVWLRSNSLERKVLLVLSTFCHFSFLQLMEWSLPHNRDTFPGCVIFFVCSFVLTAVIVVFTLLNCWIRSGLNRDSSTGSFLNRLTGSFSESRVAELILAADYLELNYTVTKNADGNGWEKRATLFDRVLALVCVLFYAAIFCMYIRFSHLPLPSRYGLCVQAVSG
uniref:Neurotransmitter-gated ion-channel ligand-binding domain-containing protein n=1 Tax=Anopheles atroparvus TaxID=41427 RepID=A0AAG5DX24_ANOAO